jgi:hypothetical protein
MSRITSAGAGNGTFTGNGLDNVITADPAQIL